MNKNGKSYQSALIVLVGGCFISLIGFGARSGFGLYLGPMICDLNWSRETFALAMALQNLLWGVCLPFAGMLSDKYGPHWVIGLGSIVYVFGIIGMAFANTPFILYITAGILVGIGVAFTSFSLATASMLRVVGSEKRSYVIGICTAAGSIGQVFYSPITQAMIWDYGWVNALLFTSFSVLFIFPLVFTLPKDPSVQDESFAPDNSILATKQAFRNLSFLLLTAGFFVCGFHVAFITVHFPVYVDDIGLSQMVGAVAISLIGVFNIFGSLISGYYGQKRSKKNGLAIIYLLRAIVILFFVLIDKSEPTIYIFAMLMGLLWLSTVPLTVGIIAHMYGIRFLATLYGFVFFSHQVGSFFGVWLGGYIFDITGSYQIMWYIGIFLGLVACLIHIPIKEEPASLQMPSSKIY